MLGFEHLDCLEAALTCLLAYLLTYLLTYLDRLEGKAAHAKGSLNRIGDAL